jgi:dihydrofolate reductase
MRKVIASVYSSLDGVMARPERWSLKYWSDQSDEYAHAQLFGCDALLLGRRTYEGFAAAWPTMTDESGFAERMNSMPKYVVTSTLDQAEWTNSTILPGKLADDVADLKARSGRDILVYGSAQLVDGLVSEGLLDELRIWLHPVLVGSTDPEDHLFGAGTHGALDLADVKTLPTGVVILSYTPA